MLYERVTYTKVEPSVVKEHRRAFKKIKESFVKWCAYHRKFDGIFSAAEIAQAKKGHLPKDCDIHHIIPLSGTYDLDVNQFFNLTVLHKSVHKKINKECFQPQLKGIDKLPYGTQIEIDVPVFDMVDVRGIEAARKQNGQDIETLAIIAAKRKKFYRR